MKPDDSDRVKLWLKNNGYSSGGEHAEILSKTIGAQKNR
jgi:hypothetical protein